MVEGCSDGNLEFIIPPEACQMVEQNFARRDMVLFDIRQKLGVAAVNGILDTVRNRLLNFSLELEDLAEKSGGPISLSKMEKKDEVKQQFHTNIYGSVGNFAQGDHASQSHTVVNGDNTSLDARLQQLGLSEEQAKEISSAAKSEQPVAGSWGPKVAAALQKIGEGAASTLIAAAVRQHYGLP